MVIDPTSFTGSNKELNHKTNLLKALADDAVLATLSRAELETLLRRPHRRLVKSTHEYEMLKDMLPRTTEMRRAGPILYARCFFARGWMVSGSWLIWLKSLRASPPASGT